jgi:rubrerythrin
VKQTWNSIDEVLAFAIEKEQEAADFYLALSRQSNRESLRELLVSFAQEELGHKAKLEAIRAGELRLAFSSTAISDLGLTESLRSTPPEDFEQLDYASALILAMNAEKAAFKMYSELARVASDDGLRQSFLGLAQEEAKHKLRFELEYDEFVLTEN